MAYLGKSPVVGNFQKCDAITVVNGQAGYTLQVGGSNVSPESANHMLVSLNGILQAPTSSFSVSGATLTFVSNLATGDVIDFVMLLGNVLDIGTPSDGTVTSGKLSGALVTPGTLDVNGQELILDADADTSITADTDDQIDFKVGGTDAMKIDSTGAITMPLQPAFGATITMNNIALSTQTTMTLSERFDTNADLSSNTFTAPVTGKYILSYHVYLTSVDADHTTIDVKIITSNKTHAVTYEPDMIFSGDSKIAATGSQICDMDASDTATFGIYIVGGSAQTDIHGDSTASGMLIG